jgi:hypothetical protein
MFEAGQYRFNKMFPGISPPGACKNHLPKYHQKKQWADSAMSAVWGRHTFVSSTRQKRKVLFNN